MKKFYALLIGIFSTVLIYSQVPGTPPQGFSYKATILKANGAIVASRTISLKISILQGSMIGTPVYTETFHPKTSEYGQIDIIIGEDGLGFIPWDQGPFFLKTEFDDKDGTNFITMSITQLLSVPFALYSGSASAANETDPIFKAHDAYQYSPSLLDNGNTAYSWGNHAGLYRPLSWVPSWSDVTGKPSFSSIAMSGSYTDLINKPVLFDGTWANLTGLPTTLSGFGITDAMPAYHAANGITPIMIENWNNAYTWGNHLGLYRPISWVPSWTDVIEKPAFSTVAVSGSYNDLTEKPVLFDGTWASLAGKPSSLSGYGITDAMTTAHDANVITSGMINNWNNSFTWGNHATAGYVTGTRTLTINGTTLDLSADRSWNVSTSGSSVALSMPDIFSVSGSPVTGTGTLSASLVSQTANLVLASPSGSAGTPLFRSLTQNDIPDLDWGKITSGKPTTLIGYGITDGVNTTGNQTIAGNKTFSGTTTVATPVNASDAATKAYVDALLTRIQQLESQPGLVKDCDGNLYPTVKIGNQVWMGENLRTTTYKDGQVIPLVTDNNEWVNLTTAGYCWYNNDPVAYKIPYGALYNWFAVNTGKLCPTGWHVATDADWTTLTTYLGTGAAAKIKETGTTHWNSPNSGATNESQFTAIPAGVRSQDNGLFMGRGFLCRIWTGTIGYLPELAFMRYISGDDYSFVNAATADMNLGYSVRCIKD